MYHLLWLKFKLFFNGQTRAVRWVSIVLIAAFVGIGLFGIIHPAHALFDCVTDPLGCATDVVSNFLLWIASIIGKLLVVLIDILIGIVQYNDFVRSAAVSQGWVVVRDLCNMFFVAVLLIIAFGTILRIESYKYQRLLPQLIIMAVLINFSKLIAGFLIDVSQVVLLTFVNAFKDTASGNFVNVFQLKEMLGFIDPSAPEKTQNIDNWQKIGLPLFAIALLIVAFLVMLAMIIVFIARIIFLWILIVLSPLAYLLSVVPMGKQYASRWWSTFGKWVTTGPILAFFIWLALSVLSTPTGNPAQVINLSGEQGAKVQEGVVSAGLGGLSSSENLLGFILAVAMLVMALGFAQALGGFAGKFAGSMMGKIQKLGSGTLKLGGAGIKSLGKKVDQAQMKLQKQVGVRAPLSMRPSVIKEGWQAWRQQKEAEHYTTTKGAWQDKFHGVLSREKTNYYDRAVRRRQSEEEAKILSNKDDEVMMELEVAIKEKNADKIAGASRKLAKQADFDNFVRARGYHTGVDGSARDFQALVRDVFMKEGGMTEQEAFRLGNDVGELAENNRQWGMSRAYAYNPKTGKFSEESEEDWANIVAAQQAKRDPQVIPRENHRTAYKNETSFLMDIGTGKPLYVSKSEEERMIDAGQARRVEADAGFHLAGRAAWGNIDPAHANRLQPNARAAVMMNHPVEAREIAPVLYNKVWESMAQMTPEELEKLEQYTKQPVETDPHTGLVTRILKRKNMFGDSVAVPFEETSKKFWDDHLGGKFTEWKKAEHERTGRVFSTDEKSVAWKDESREFYDNVFLRGQREAVDKLRADRLAGRLAPVGATAGASGATQAGAQPAQQPQAQPQARGAEFDSMRYEDQQAYLGTRKKVEEYERDAKGDFFTTDEYTNGIRNGQFVMADQYRRIRAQDGMPPESALRDIDQAQYEATKAKAEEYQKTFKADFFLSDEYKKGAAQGQYLEREVYDEAKAIEAYKKEHGTEGLRGVATYGSKDSHNVLAMDFSGLKVEGMDMEKAAGEYITDPDVLAEIKPQLLAMIDKEIGDLQAKPLGERTKGDQQRMNALQAAKDKINDEEAFKKLKLANLGRTGFGIRHILTHEDMHEKLEEVDPDGALRQQIWQEMSPEARQIATEQVKHKMTNQGMSEDQVISEYFAEGLANAGRRTAADRSASAITLPPAALERLAEKVKVPGPIMDVENIEAPAPISKRDMKRVAKTDRKQEKAQEKAVKKTVKAEKKAGDAQRDANAKNFDYQQARQAREQAEQEQEKVKRSASDEVRRLQEQAKNEQALMQQSVRSGDKAGADTHRKNFNAISQQIEAARKRVQTGEQKLYALAEKEEQARLAAVQAMEESIKHTQAAGAGNEQINAVQARERAQRGVQNLRGRQVMDDASAAKVDSALSKSDYTAAFAELENARKRIEANPEAFSDEIVSLQDQIKRGNTSLQLGVPGKMADQIKGDIAKWQSRIAELTTGMTGQIDAIMKGMSDNIPEAKNLYRPAPAKSPVAPPSPTAGPETKPADVPSPIAQLTDKIKTAQTSLRLGVGGKVAEQIKQDMAGWQAELDKLQSPMNTQIAELKQKIAGAETSLQLGVGGKMAEQIRRDIAEWQSQIRQLEFAKTGETVKLDALASRAVKPNVSEEEKKTIDQAARQEMEKVAPSEAVATSRPVQESAQHLEALTETLKNANITSEAAQRTMEEINKGINELSKSIQGSQKETAAFVKHVTAPMSKQAQAGSVGQFGVNSEEWKKFMYNMTNLYKFFRDKSPKKGGQPDSRQSGGESSPGPDNSMEA